MGAQGLFEDFFCLQVASVGEINIRLGHRVHVSGCIKLAGGVGHGRARNVAFARIDALSAAGTEEGIGLQTALEERAVYVASPAVLAIAIKAQTGQQRQQSNGTG